MTPILDREKPASTRLALYALISVIAFYTIAALLEEVGFNTNIEFGRQALRFRKELIFFAVFALPALVFLPELGFRLHFDEAGRKLRVTRLYLFWKRSRDWEIDSRKGLVARRKVKAIRVVYDVEFVGEDQRGPYLFTLSRIDVEEDKVLDEISSRLGLPFEVDS